MKKKPNPAPPPEAYPQWAPRQRQRAAGAGGSLARRVRAVNGAGAGAVPRATYVLICRQPAAH
jgi:hypothetical protein